MINQEQLQDILKISFLSSNEQDRHQFLLEQINLFIQHFDQVEKVVQQDEAAVSIYPMKLRTNKEQNQSFSMGQLEKMSTLFLDGYFVTPVIINKD